MLSRDLQSLQSRRFIYSFIYCFHGNHKCLHILVWNIPDRVTDLSDDAVLDLRFGKYWLNERNKTDQSVGASYKDILSSTVRMPLITVAKNLALLVSPIGHGNESHTEILLRRLPHGRCCHSLAMGRFLSVTLFTVISEASTLQISWMWLSISMWYT